MSRRLLIGNWKMHGDGASLSAIAAIAGQAAAAPGVEVALCLPATLIHRAAACVPVLPIGGQDCHPATHGAHTGEISAAMLREAGARLVILGHSERRAMGEGDALIAAKVRAAQAAGLRVVLCVGETMADRAAGQALAVVDTQLHRALDSAVLTAGIVIAYEPVWAIGSGAAPAPHEVAVMARHIRARVGDVPMLYGGSVTPERCAPLIAGGGIDGLLVGGASLSPTTFGAMIASLDRAAQEVVASPAGSAIRDRYRAGSPGLADGGDAVEKEVR